MNRVQALRQANSVLNRQGEKRSRLREFQAQLLERMQEARANETVNVSQLGVLIGQTHYLLNLHEAGEIISVGKITRVPLTQDWYLGLVSIRGNLFGVADIQRFQGSPSLEINQDCRIIGFSAALGFNCSLLVSRVLGLRNVTEMTLQSEPEHEAKSVAVNWKERNYLDSNHQVWTELSLAGLIQNSYFLHIGT